MMTPFTSKGPPPVSLLWFNLADATKNLFTDVGTVNVLNIQSGIPNGLPLSTDMNLSILIANTNTAGNVTLAVDTSSPIPVVNPDGTQVALAQLHAGAIVVFKFDGTRFQVISATDALFADGSAVFPSIAFNDAPGTGFYLAGPNTLGCSTAGQQRWTIDGAGSWVMNAPTGPNPTVTLNGSGNGTSPALSLINSANLNCAVLSGDNLNDGALAFNGFSLACGATAAKKVFIGATVSNANFAGNDFLNLGGPVGAFGMLNAGAFLSASFGLFSGNELRLLLPSTPGSGISCYSANAGTFSDITTDHGSFTGTLSGMTSTVQGAVFWIRRGSEVEIFLTSGLLGTSNSTAMSLSGLPAVLIPDNSFAFGSQHAIFFGITDNGQIQTGLASIQINGTVAFNVMGVSGTQLVSNVFTASGSKGIVAGVSFKYKTHIN